MVFYILLKLIYNHNNHTVQCCAAINIPRTRLFQWENICILNNYTSTTTNKCKRDDELKRLNMKSQCIMVYIIILYIISLGNWKFRVLCKHKQIFSRKLWSLGGVNNHKEPGPGPGPGRSSGRGSCQRGKQSSLSASWAPTSGGGGLSEPPGNDVIRCWQQYNII